MTINTKVLQLAAQAHRDVDAYATADLLRDAADEINAQAAEIARLKATQTWQPIETAPKDGSTVVLRSRGGHTADGYWLQAAFNGCGAWIWPYVHSEPTYWMPLPAAPAALSGESKC